MPIFSNKLSNLISSFAYENFIINGNFKDTTNYSSSGALMSTSNNTMTVTGTGSISTPVIFQSYSADLLIKNDKWFQMVQARVTNDQATNMLMRISDGVTSYSAIISSPIINQWYLLSQVATITTTTPTLFQPQIRHSYATSAIANGKSMEIKEFFMINLTTLYGAGNEPSAADCANIFKFVDGNTQPNFSKQIAT